MITLKFLATWLKIAAIAAAVFLAEYIFIHAFWWFTATAALTLVTFAAVSVVLWREWRSMRHGNGDYTYQLVHYVRD